MLPYVCVGTAVLLITLVLCGLLLFKWWNKGPKYHNERSLEGMTAIVTGGTSGVGKQTVCNLSWRGARVILMTRDHAKGVYVAGEIKGETQGEIQVETCDLSSLQSVQAFCDRILAIETQVHLLINCAGVKNTPEEWKSREDYEYQFAVNYISHFFLTHLLLPVIKRVGPGARIINVSCAHHRNAQAQNFTSDILFSSRSGNYALSKLAVAMFSKELARILEAEGSGVNVYCADPGLCNTSLGRYTRQSSGFIVTALQAVFYWPWLRTPKNGAQTIIYCAVDEDINNHTGSYYKNCALSLASPQVDDDDRRAALWSMTNRMVGIM